MLIHGLFVVVSLFMDYLLEYDYSMCICDRKEKEEKEEKEEKRNIYTTARRAG